MGGLKRAVDMCFSCGGTSSPKWERVGGIYTHHPKTSRWLLSPGISGKTPDTPESPKLVVRFKSSGYSGHLSGIFGKFGVSGKFPGISEASLVYSEELWEHKSPRRKSHNFLLRTPNSMILDSMESLFRGASIPTENKLQNHQVHVL
jgi:hypothetical protein